MAHGDDGSDVVYHAQTHGRFEPSDVKNLRWDMDFNADDTVDACMLVTQNVDSESGLEAVIYGDGCGQMIVGTATRVTRADGSVTVLMPLQNVRDAGLGSRTEYAYAVSSKSNPVCNAASRTDKAPDDGVPAIVHVLGASASEPGPDAHPHDPACEVATPSPSPTPSPTPSPAPTATPTPSPAASPSPSSTPAPTPSATSTAGPAAAVKLDTPFGSVGGSVSLSGEGFAPNVSLRIELHSDPVALGTVMTDAAGEYETTVGIPTTIPAGRHSLVVSGIGIDGALRTVATPIDILAAGLPVTGDAPGSPGVVLVVLAGVLIAAGLAVWRRAHVR